MNINACRGLPDNLDTQARTFYGQLHSDSNRQQCYSLQFSFHFCVLLLQPLLPSNWLIFLSYQFSSTRSILPFPEAYLVFLLLLWPILVVEDKMPIPTTPRDEMNISGALVIRSNICNLLILNFPTWYYLYNQDIWNPLNVA